jgi:hypothetical protein
MNLLSGFVKLLLALLAFGAMGIGVTGIWGYTDPDTTAKSIMTLVLIGITVSLVDTMIYRK